MRIATPEVEQQAHLVDTDLRGVISILEQRFAEEVSPN